MKIDYYFTQAKVEGYRSRSAYKLLEIHKKHKIFKPEMFILDLGSSPGGWLQVIKNYFKKGKIIAIDKNPILPIRGVEIILGDIREKKTIEDLMKIIGKKKLDLILSDLSPKITGINSFDQKRSFDLAEIVFSLTKKILKNSGILLIKLFQGIYFQEYHKKLKNHFNQVILQKPKASRNYSREIYLLGKSFRKIKDSIGF